MQESENEFIGKTESPEDQKEKEADTSEVEPLMVCLQLLIY